MGDQWLTAKEYREKVKSEKGKNKYRAQKTVIDGESFPSRLEADVYQLLLLMQKNGEISDLRRYHTVHLTRARIALSVDFSAEENGERVWIEAKGVEVPVWAIKKRLWKYYGPGPLRIYKRGNGNVYLSEELIPTSREGT